MWCFKSEIPYNGLITHKLHLHQMSALRSTSTIKKNVLQELGVQLPQDSPMLNKPLQMLEIG